MDKTEQLHRFVELQSSRAFCWGERDCGLFAADWLLERTGQDVAKSLRGFYHCEEGALSQMQLLGYQNLSETVHALLGRPLEVSAMAQRGDIALIESRLGIACGVVTSQGVLAQTYRGLTTVPLSKVIAAWSIA